MSFYPALQIDRADHDLVLAVVDDFGPVAAEERGQSLLVFFPTAAQRDDAATAITLAMPHTTVVARDVDDEDWARRSQENLAPIQVGAITVIGGSGLGAGDLKKSPSASPELQRLSLASQSPAPSPAPEPQSPAPSSR